MKLLLVAVVCAALATSAQAEKKKTPGKIILAPNEFDMVVSDPVKQYKEDMTAWACTALDKSKPWVAYAAMEGYLNKGNEEKKDMKTIPRYPIMHVSSTAKKTSFLCIYLDKEEHCYPPKPNSKTVKVNKVLNKTKYVGIRFWGQASDKRVEYYVGKLNAGLSSKKGKVYDDRLHLSYYPDQMKEVRYGLKP